MSIRAMDPSDAFLDPALRVKVNKGTDATFDVALPYRAWVKEPKRVVDGEAVENTDVFYFFSNPRDKSQWAYVETVNLAFHTITGITEKVPWPIAFCVVDSPIIEKFENGEHTKRFAQDPILSILSSTGKYAREDHKAKIEQTFITSFVDDQGEVKILVLKRSEYEELRDLVDEQIEMDPNYTLRGTPVRLVRPRGGRLRMRPVTDANPLDMDQYTPKDLDMYINDVRSELEKWLQARGVTVGSAPASDPRPVNTAVGEVAPEYLLIELENDQLYALAKAKGLAEVNEKTPRNAMLTQLAPIVTADDIAALTVAV